MIGTVGPCLPFDLLEATGRHAGPLVWQTGRPTPTADQWLESKFPQWAQSIVEDWAQGTFDHLKAVLFSRADDAAQRLYYYLCELQRRRLVRGPELLIFDVAKIDRASSQAHSITAVRRLADAWSVDETTLERAIVTANQDRRTAPSLSSSGSACLIIGTPPQTMALHEAVAEAGFAPIGPTLSELWSDPGPAVDEGTGDPVAAIGRQVHARPDDQRGFQDDTLNVLDRARQSRAAAAILWYTEEDEARVWELPPIREALSATGLPMLVMTRRDASARDGAPEEIRAFLEGLRS